MHRNLLVAIVVIAACGHAVATSSVSFEATDYLLDIAVGDDDRPVIAGLHIATPQIPKGAQVPVEFLTVEAFDTSQKVLLLRFDNPGRSQLPGSFALSARQDVGILQIDGKSVTGRFRWGAELAPAR